MPIIQTMNIESWPAQQQAILELEAIAFSPAQCHSAEFYLNILSNGRNLSYVALKDDKLVGFLFSAPLELFSKTAGVIDDPFYGEHSVVYIADMVVNPECRRQGIAKALKQQHILDAKKMGYRAIAGRNRLLYADAMWQLNQTLGAKEIQRLSGIYKDGREPNECIYHHIVI